MADDAAIPSDKSAAIGGRCLTKATSNRYYNWVQRYYDAAGRLTSEVLAMPESVLTGTTLSTLTKTVSYQYDADNRLTQLTYPTTGSGAAGSVVTRTYTDRDQLASINTASSSVATRTYDAGGRLTQTAFGNGLAEDRTYVPGSSLTATMSTKMFRADPVLTGFSYAYDADGRKTSETDLSALAAQQAFSYDDASRLTSWNRTGTAPGTQSWNLSLVGDWNSTTRDGVPEARLHSQVHEATQVGTNILSYDTKGNLTTDEHGNALSWDPENRLTVAQVTPDASTHGFGARATYTYDALGRRVAKTVDNRTTVFLHAGAQVVATIEQIALPGSQGQITGQQTDGSISSLILPPASGGILPTRINCQPSTSLLPAGYLKDTGKAYGARTNSYTYGWSADMTANAVARNGAVPLVEFDTFIQMQPDAGGSNRWSIALPNGTYPVAVVCGDALSTEQTNNLTIGNQTVTDLTPSATAGYNQGNFDGYLVLATVTNGMLTIAPASGAYHAKLCFVEIGAIGQAISQTSIDKLAALIQRANDATSLTPQPTLISKEYFYGSYVDEVLAYTQNTGAGAVRNYVHANHLYSPSALTNASGAVVERYRYTAYGKQTVTNAAGTALAKSAVGIDRGFTGYIADQETGLLHARYRVYSTSLGRFIGRDPLEYVNGTSLYGAYFSPNGLDPMGLCAWYDVPCMAAAVGRGAAAIGAGLAQGVTNVVNGAKNALLGITDIPRQIWNAGTWYFDRAGITTPSVAGPAGFTHGDWSIPQTDGMRNWNRDLFANESDEGHAWSEGLGGAGATMLMPLPKIPKLNSTICLDRNLPRLVPDTVTIPDAALVHISPNPFPMIRPNEGSSFWFRYGEIKNLTPAQVEGLIGSNAVSGQPGAAQYLHIMTPDAALQASAQPYTFGFTEYVMKVDVNPQSVIPISSLPR